jgi:tripartite-type tricarboxylate transporter receptor subunit TctC
MIACRTVLAMAAAMVIAPLLLAPGVARADWPDRPIKWVVPFGPGGANEAGLFAPKGTPPAIVERMSKELEAAVKSAEFRDKMVPSGTSRCRRLAGAQSWRARRVRSPEYGQ